MEFTPAEKALVSSLLAKHKLEKAASLENTNKIDDKEFRTKVTKSLRTDLKEIEELQYKMKIFDA